MFKSQVKKLKLSIFNRGTNLNVENKLLNEFLPNFTKIPDITTKQDLTLSPNEQKNLEFDNYIVLKRDFILNDTTRENGKILFPVYPYHKRLENYFLKRNEIFNYDNVCQISNKRIPRRSTQRLRRFYKNRKLCSKLLISAIVANPKDGRYYAKVSFLNFEELGLIDTGASISCIGSDLAKSNFHKFPNFSNCKSLVKTADGATQKVIGWLSVDLKFRDKVFPFNLFLIPSAYFRYRLL